MTRLRPWLDVVFGPLVAFSLCVLDQFRPQETWHDDLERQFAAIRTRSRLRASRPALERSLGRCCSSGSRFSVSLIRGKRTKGKTLRCRCCGSMDIEEVPL
jgi:hypothetical protein